MPYQLFADGRAVPLGDRRYLLSPRDLSGLEALPDIVRAGVASLKIEGRLKSAEYVASITRVYRQALDRVMADLAAPGAARFDPAADRYELEMSFSRGLSTGWLRGTDNQALVHARFGTKRGVFLGEVLRVAGESASLRLSAPLSPGDGVVFDAGRPEEKEEGGRVYEVLPDGAPGGGATLRFGRGDIDWRRVRPGHLVWKTNDPALDGRIRATYAGDAVRFRRPVHFEAHGRAGAPLVVIADDGLGHAARGTSASPLAAARNQPLTEERLREQLGRLGGTPFELGLLRSFVEGEVMLPMSELNGLRRELIAKLEGLRSRPRRWTMNPGAGAMRPVGRPGPVRPGVPELIAVIRLPVQLEAAWGAGARTIYCEFENPKHYRDAVARFRELRSGLESVPPGDLPPPTIWVAPPRIFKPGEEWILNQVRSCNADGYLVRNYDHLAFFSGERRRGDFSLNVANQWSAEAFVREIGLERVTASYDLNISQLEALLRSAPPAWFDITIHQRMPMFHMEHCVFCAFLTDGHDYRDCGRPCESRRVELADRTGALLPLKADAGCRNTVFNNRAQTGAEFASRLLGLGARAFRVEFVNEPAEEVARTVRSYARLLRGEIEGGALWRELKLINQLGVTRGQMDSEHRALRRKG